MEELILRAIPRYRWTADKVVEGVSLIGKNIIVTGATSGIGIPTVTALARTGANVYFTARDASRGVSTLNLVKSKSGNDKVECLSLDLSSFKSINDFVSGWGSKPVDVLLHNAGVMASPYTLTVDKEEQQQQVNFFSVVLLTEKLRPLLTPEARVVIVSSSAHKRLAGVPDFLEPFNKFALEQCEAGYDKWVAYCVAKSAVLMYSNALNEEFKAAGSKITVNALHPGGILTGLQASLSKEELQGLGWIDKDGNVAPAFKNVEEGASTSVWGSVSSELAGHGGLYLENCEVTPKDFYSAPSNDPNADLISRLKGTAPHVWNLEHCAAVTEAARKRLAAKGFL